MSVQAEITRINTAVTNQSDLINQLKASLGVPVATFAENSWRTIISACQSGTVPSTWVVGNQKTMTIDGTDYIVDIIGKNHDTYTAGGTAPLTFQLHDCYNTTYAMRTGVFNNSGGYDSTNMHTTYLPAIKFLMPDEVKSAIKAVDKKSGIGDSNATDIETVSCDLFLLSEVEITGSASYTTPGEGSQYDYYKNGGNDVRKKYINGTATSWWLRSPDRSSSSDYCYIYTFPIVGSNGVASQYGVSFAFCF